jgi:eukaryotic-like serine/threonine-protein kinase
VQAPLARRGERDAAAAGSWELHEGDEIAPGRHTVRLLGGGRRYEAFLAWDDELLTLVVAKLLRPSLVGDPAAHAAIEAEARTLARLHHPVVVRSFGAELEGPRPHLVLEHLDGPRLSTLLRTSVVAVEQVLTLGLQLASALHYLHRRDTVHLDVKPRNVIMGGPPRLIDLSIAKRTEELAHVTVPLGTTAYMAPEQAHPAFFATLGPPADVWGLGATLHEALAKRPAFPGSSEEPGAAPAERYPQLVRGPEPLPRAVPAPLAALVRSCLEFDPAARPAPAELAAELERLVARLPRPRLGRLRPGGKKGESTLSRL